MLDRTIRRRIGDGLNRMGGALASRGVPPAAITLLGFAVGIGCCLAVATQHWTTALLLWLVNRAADGLDGPVARNGVSGPTDLGGFIDIMADFAIYGGVLVAVGYALPGARMAALVVFGAYYLNGTAFLAWSSLAEKGDRRSQGAGGKRSLEFPAGLAEGTETILAYVVLLLFPGSAEPILYIWATIVGITVIQRVFFVSRQLGI